MAQIGTTERTNELLQEASKQTGIAAPTFSTVIPTTSLQPTTPFQAASSTPDTTNYAGVTGGVTDSIINDYNTLKKQADEKLKAQETGATDITKLMEAAIGKTADTQAANEQAGVNAETASLNKYTQQLADLNAQASSLNREAQAIPLQTQENNRNTGATDRGIAPQDAGALRLNAIKALSIGQQSDIAAAAATGSMLRLSAAKDKAQQIIDLKYKPLEDALAIKKEQFELNKSLLESIDKKRTDALSVALAKEKQLLDDKKAYEKANTDKSSEYAKYAFDAGQSDIAAQISSLDPSAKTFSADLAKLQAQIKNPLMDLDLAIKQTQLQQAKANLSKTYKETGLLGKPTPAEEKAAKEALTNAKASLPAMQDKVTAIDTLLSHPGITATVGPNIFARSAPDFNAFTGVRQEFVGGIQKVLTGLTLQNLVDAKAQGATFGALSDSELNLLANSASVISNWEVKDKNGKVTGWNVSEKAFKKELENIKNLTNRSILLSEGTVISPDEQSLLSTVYGNQSIDPSNYYQK